MTDTDTFVYKKEFKIQGDISKFIEYRLNYGLQKGCPYFNKVRVKSDTTENGIRKVVREIRKDIMNLPEMLNKIINIAYFLIDEQIIITDDKFLCTMKAPPSVAKYFDFQESLECTSIDSENNEMIAILKCEAKHGTPFKETIQNMYVTQRLHKLQEEFENSKPDIDMYGDENYD